MKTEITVTGVYATFHTNRGDIEANLTEVEVAGSIFTFHLVVQDAPFNGQLQSSTLHCGLLNSRHDLNKALFRRGDRIEAIHPVSLGSMTIR